MYRLSIWAAIVVVSLSITGCASVTVKPFSKYDTHTQGFRLPERKPLVVLMGGNVQVIWVCNPDKGSAMQFGSFLAKHHFVVNFDGCGSPTSVDSDQDSTAVPLKLLDIVNGVAERAFPSGEGKSGASTNAAGPTPFQIFDVRFGSDDSVSLVPLVHPGDLVRLSLSGGGDGGVIGTTGGGAG